MANTVSGVHLSGTAGGTPTSGYTVGALYSETDTNATLVASGTATWSTWHTDRVIVAGSATVKGTVSTLNFTGGTVTVSGGTATFESLATGGGGGSVVFYDEGTVKGTAAIINVTGSGGTLSVSGGTAIIDISASSGGMTMLSDTTLGADTASFDLTSISGSYKDLRVVLQVRSDRSAATGDAVRMRFNNDSGSNYDEQYVQWYATTTAAAESLGQTSFAVVFEATAVNAPAGAAAQAVIDIVNYAGTAWQKTYTCHASTPQGTGTQGQRNFSSAGNWRSTAAVTRITIAPVNGSNFKSGSRCTLYGIS